MRATTPSLWWSPSETPAEEYYPGTRYLAGEGVSTYDLMDTVTADMVKVNLVAIGAVFVVLLFTMKSLIAPIILVLSIETAIWINLSIPYFSDQNDLPHRLSDHQLHPAWRDGGLRHSVHRPV